MLPLSVNGIISPQFCILHFIKKHGLGRLLRPCSDVRPDVVNAFGDNIVYFTFPFYAAFFRVTALFSPSFFQKITLKEIVTFFAILWTYSVIYGIIKLINYAEIVFGTERLSKSL